MLKLAIITTTRADYGLLCPLIKKTMADDYFEVDLIATGTHLSHINGYTVSDIEKDGFTVAYRISYLNDDEFQDSPSEICKIISDGIIKFTDLFEKTEYDAIVALGDRYELLSFCIPAFIKRIPIIHLYGGEVTSGAIDDSIRHCVTKLSSVHFPTTELHKKRILALGENERYVINAGALGVDNIIQTEYLSDMELRKSLKINNDKPLGLITYHPVTLEDYEDVDNQIVEVLEAALKYENLFYIITMPNADHGSRKILNHISNYASSHQNRFVFYESLGQRRYLSALKVAKVMIGNSSSGILESPSFRLPVVNIGDRQKGRFRSKNIIDCKCDRHEIILAIEKALSKGFKNEIKDLESPFGNGQAAEIIVSHLKRIDFMNKEELLKKDFHMI